jgi:hypothetical protein
MCCTAEENENVIVHRSGLVIHPEQRYIAGNPDGIVSVSTGETGLVEIKNLLHSKPINLWQASLNKNFCLENINGKLQLNPNHNYFYQCQGLLNICNTDWIDFIVRTLHPHQIFIHRNQRSKFMGEYYIAKTSSILFQGSASRTSLSKRWKISWHSRTWIYESGEGISCRFRLLPPLVNTYPLNVNMYIYMYVNFLKAANGIIKSDKCYIVSACIFEILPIIQVLDCQDIFHLLEKLVLEAEP